MAVLGNPRSTDGEGPRICVVGAGPCGITTIKNLRDEGLNNIVCYDEGDEIGGNWVYSERSDRMSVYACTHIISSKTLSSFDDFPMPANYPDFPSHRQLLAYFKQYATTFNVSRHIRLRTRVIRADRGSDGKWVVQSECKDPSMQMPATETFDYLLVCAGHHRDAFVPSHPGNFNGMAIHSSSYRRGDPFRDQRVLVVGAGNSGCDIAADVSRFATSTSISMRHGAYIVPKLMFGRPIDTVVAAARKFIPKPLLQPFLRVSLHMAIGPWEAYGLQRPLHGPLEMHPTLNSSLLEALRSGDVSSRPGIDRLDGKTIHFDDGTNEEFDTIIWATGFRTSFPFLSRQVTNWQPNGTPNLYLKMMHGEISNIYFIGFFQPIGCIWNLADYQARIAARHISGRLALPKDLAGRILHEKSRPHWHYSASPRHAIEVDVPYFRKELRRELTRKLH